MIIFSDEVIYVNLLLLIYWNARFDLAIGFRIDYAFDCFDGFMFNLLHGFFFDLILDFEVRSALVLRLALSLSLLAILFRMAVPV